MRCDIKNPRQSDITFYKKNLPFLKPRFQRYFIADLQQTCPFAIIPSHASMISKQLRVKSSTNITNKIFFRFLVPLSSYQRRPDLQEILTYSRELQNSDENKPVSFVQKDKFEK